MKEIHIREIQSLTDDLKKVLANNDFDAASELLMLIEREVNFVKFLSRQVGVN